MTAVERLTPKQLARFEAKISHEPNGCWLWTARIHSNGYGALTVANRRLLAHRVSYQHFVGPIRDGLQIDHLCRVRHCVNPAHLEAVTCAENIRRGNTGKAAATRAALVTHCPKGHEYTPENTALDTRGCRHCRACHRERSRQRSKTNEYRERRRLYMREWNARRKVAA